jgi:hypothetical protein
MSSIVKGQTYSFTTSTGIQLSKADRKAGKPAYVSETCKGIAREMIPLSTGNLELWRVEDFNGETHNLWASQLTKIGEIHV